MPVQTACTACSAKLKIKDELIGKSIKCPKCSAVFKAVSETEPETAGIKNGVPAKVAAAPAVPAAPAAKKPPPPPPAWDDADEEEDVEEKPKKKAKARDDDDEDEDEDEKPKRKPALKEFDDDGEPEDTDEEAPFKELLAASPLNDDTRKQIKADLGLREQGIWFGQPDPKIMAVRALGKSAVGVFIVSIFCIVLGVIGGNALENFKLLAVLGIAAIGSSSRPPC